MTTATETNTAAKIETQTCGRCGGSGRYSYCQMYGSTCFDCRGRKLVLTKRGEAAQRFLRALRSAPVTEIKIGDRVKVGRITLNGTPYEQIETVTSVERAVEHYERNVNGEMVPFSMIVVNIETNRGSYQADVRSTIYRVDPPAVQRGQYAAALAYQATLGPNGKPLRK